LTVMAVIVARSPSGDNAAAPGAVAKHGGAR
jgi:hypothetical protein